MVEQNTKMIKLLENKDFDLAIDYAKEHSIDLDEKLDNVRKPFDYLIKHLYQDGKMHEEIKDVIKTFHSNGMSIEETKDSNYLHSAIANNDAEMTGWLFKTNEYSIEDRFIALNISFNEGVDFKVFKNVLENFPESNQFKNSLLFSMAEHGYKGSENKMFSLMHTSQGINVENEQGQTLLHKLSENGNPIILKAALSSHELDVNKKDVNGETALFKLSGADNIIDNEVIKSKLKLLVESGVNVLEKNNENKDAFEANKNIKDLKGYALSISVESKKAAKDKVAVRKHSRKM